MRIYTVSTIRRKTHYRMNGTSYQLPDTRTPAVVMELGDAKQIIEKNELDISEEGYYPYALIEEIILPSFHGIPNKEIWYSWDGQRYVECHKPEEWRNIAAWSVG